MPTRRQTHGRPVARNAQSSGPSGSASRQVSSVADVGVFHSWNCIPGRGDAPDRIAGGRCGPPRAAGRRGDPSARTDLSSPSRTPPLTTTRFGRPDRTRSRPGGARESTKDVHDAREDSGARRLQEGAARLPDDARRIPPGAGDDRVGRAGRARSSAAPAGGRSGAVRVGRGEVQGRGILRLHRYWQAREISRTVAAPDFPFDPDLLRHVSPIRVEERRHRRTLHLRPGSARRGLTNRTAAHVGSVAISAGTC